MLFSNATTTNLSTLGADVSVATSISDSGLAAAYNIFDANPNPISRGFLYSASSMTDIQSEDPQNFRLRVYCEREAASS
jgi:hypothetical protein